LQEQPAFQGSPALISAKVELKKKAAKAAFSYSDVTAAKAAFSYYRMAAAKAAFSLSGLVPMATNRCGQIRTRTRYTLRYNGR
jgi:hypothetical protein